MKINRMLPNALPILPALGTQGGPQGFEGGIYDIYD